MSSEATQVHEASARYLEKADAQCVPPGYKRTEVGVIPKEWKVFTLGIICSFENGDRSANYPSPGSFVPEGIPFINAGHVSEGRIDLHDMDYIIQEVFNRLGCGKVECGDILFCLRGSLGKFGVVEPGFGKGAIASSLVIVRPRKRDVIREFLVCYFASDYCSRMIERWAGGAAQPNLGAQDLARFTIPIPSVSEQRAIAEALSDVDGLLGALAALIAKKRAIKQAAMQQLLTGKTRLPGFSGEWKEIRLGDLFLFKNGLNKAKGFFGHGTPIVNYMDVFGKAALASSELAGRVELSKQEIQNFDVRQGDVFFTRTSETADEIGIAAVMLDEPADTVFSGFLLRGRPKNQRMRDEFKAYCFASLSVRSQIISTASYTTRALTNGKLLSRISLMLPPRAEQLAIAAVLSDMDAEIAALEHRRDKTKQIKRGMMQQLLTGRVRLVKPAVGS